MTPQESQALKAFLDQLTQVKGIAKDPQADAMIAQAVAQQPDAAYLLTQRAMLLEHALDNAKARIAQLESQAQAAPQQSTSFLDPGNAWGRSAVSPPPQQSPAPPMAAPQTARPGLFGGGAGGMARPGFLGAGGGSFLGNLAATAAGVAGGAFLFQGIQNLLGEHGAGAASKLSDAGSNLAADTSGFSSDALKELDTGTANDNPADNNFADNSQADDSGLNDDSLGLDDGLGNADQGSDDYDGGGLA